MGGKLVALIQFQPFFPSFPSPFKLPAQSKQVPSFSASPAPNVWAPNHTCDDAHKELNLAKISRICSNLPPECTC